MAVIKQRRQFLPQSIGVVRANTGAQEVARSVGGLANAMIETSFDELKKQARDRGQELAELADLRAIDPKTGKIQALTVPTSLGRAAADSYEELIEKRYVSQTEQDFKTKAAELAVAYEFDPDGVAKFSTEFGEYIEETAANASPKFASAFRNFGAALLSSNKLSLQQDANRRERRNLASEAAVAIDNAVSAYRDIVSLHTYAPGSPSANDAETLRGIAMMEFEDAQKLFPDLITPAEIEKAEANFNLATDIAVGNRIINKIELSGDMDYATVNQVVRVVRARGAGLQDLPKDIQMDVSELLMSPTFADNVDTVMQDIKQYGSDKSNEATIARIEAQEKESDEDEKRRNAQLENRFELMPKRERAVSSITDALNNNDFANAGKLFNEYSKAAIASIKGVQDEGAINAVNGNISYVRDFMLDQIVNKANGTAANASDLSKFANYVMSNGKAQDKPEGEMLTLADNFIELSRGVNVQDKLNGLVSDARRLASDEAATRASQADLDTAAAMSTGFADNSTASVKRVADQLVRPKGSMPDWYLGEGFESRAEWLTKLMTQANGALPGPLINALKGSLKGSFDNRPEDLVKLAQYYAQGRQMPSAFGTPRNLWQDHLSAGEIGLLEGALTVASFEGIDNFPSILATLRGAWPDGVPENQKVFDDKLRSLFGEGKTLKDLTAEYSVTETFGFSSDIPNPNIAGEIEPLVKWAILSNNDSDGVKDMVMRYVDQHYPETNGIIIDTVFGTINRSKFALSKTFHEKTPQAIAALNSIIQRKVQLSGAEDDPRNDYYFGVSIDNDRLRESMLVGGPPLPPGYKSPDERRMDELEAILAGEMDASEGTPLGSDVGIRVYLSPQPLAPVGGEKNVDTVYQMYKVNDRTGQMTPAFIHKKDANGNVFAEMVTIRMSEIYAELGVAQTGYVYP
jgi:hypothetical protein